jgi:hypothetical protein
METGRSGLILATRALGSKGQGVRRLYAGSHRFRRDRRQISAHPKERNAQQGQNATRSQSASDQDPRDSMARLRSTRSRVIALVANLRASNKTRPARPGERGVF